MPEIVGKKLKIMDALDKASADSILSEHTIELVLTKSPQKEVKCGAIAVFKINPIKEIEFKDNADPREVFEMQKEMNNMTEAMLWDPELFKETEGRWLNWALPRVLQIFTLLNTDADVIVKSPKLKIRHKIPRKEVIAGRNEPKKLFHIAYDIDKLLSGDFSFDPWGRVIRRGRIGAEFKK